MTGGTGFLGYHLVTTLVNAGARVRVFALSPPANHPIHQVGYHDIVSGDVRDATAVRRALSGCSVVMHAAGNVAVWGPGLAHMRAVHVEGTRTVLSALDPQARMIHTSSIVAFGGSTRPVAFEEASPLDEDLVDVEYVRAKRQAEAVALTSNRDVVVVNPGYLFGPGDFDGSVMGRLCLRFWRGRVLAVPPGGVCAADVRDVAVGHLLAAEHGTRGERYILGGENLSYDLLFRMLGEVAGMRPRFMPRISPVVFTAIAAISECRGRVKGREPYPSLAHARLSRRFWYGVSDRASRELGYAARDLRETLADAYAWHAARETFRCDVVNRWLLRPPDTRS